MKKIIFMLIMSIMQICLFAQENKQINVRQVLPLLYANIAKKAADKWPGDYEMQKYTIEKECNAYIEYIAIRTKTNSIPEDVLKQVCIAALDKWCNNDWKNCVNETTEIDAMHACWDADWEMIVYTMKKQFDAYNSLK